MFPEVQHNDFYIVAYNVGSRGSFDEMRSIHEETLVMRQTLLNPVPWRGGLVVATASDLSGQANAVSTQLGLEFAQSRGLDFLETSAKTGHGCTEVDLISITTNLLFQSMDKLAKQ